MCRLLAEGDLTKAQLARRFGISRTAMTRFARRHKARIEEIRADLDDEFADLWIVRKANRLAAYESDFELASGHPNASHHEWVKSRTQILHAVAQELCQLPGRNGISVVMPVAHVIEGIDLDQLK